MSKIIPRPGKEKNPRNSFDKNHYNIENHEETLYLYNISSNQLGINRKFTVQIFARNVWEKYINFVQYITLSISLLKCK